MLKREEKALRELLAKWKVPEALSYASNPEHDDGIDMGRENAADELEYLLDRLVKVKKDA